MDKQRVPMIQRLDESPVRKREPADGDTQAAQGIGVLLVALGVFVVALMSTGQLGSAMVAGGVGFLAAWLVALLVRSVGRN